MLLSLLLLLAAFAASNAFLASTIRGGASLISPGTALRQSSGDGDDGSSTINVALVTASNDEYDELQTTLKDHPFCQMTGVKLSVADVPAGAEAWNKEVVGVLQHADIACFDTTAAVKTYLANLDRHLGVADDASDEERRKMPNKPDLVGDILGASDEAAPMTGATLMAACPNADAARECLNSGRWMTNHIYYPKETQGEVELKTESIDGDDGDVEAEDAEAEIDLQIWADSVVQAAGDVMERKFWGGGW